MPSPFNTFAITPSDRLKVNFQQHSSMNANHLEKFHRLHRRTAKTNWLVLKQNNAKTTQEKEPTSDPVCMPVIKGLLSITYLFTSFFFTHKFFKQFLLLKDEKHEDIFTLIRQTSALALFRSSWHKGKSVLNELVADGTQNNIKIKRETNKESRLLRWAQPTLGLRSRRICCNDITNCSTHTINLTIKLSNHRKRRDSYRMKIVLCSHKKGNEKQTNTQTNLIENGLGKTCHAFTRKLHVPPENKEISESELEFPFV